MTTIHVDHDAIDPAPLARDEIGPFLLLGVDKTADAETIERHWTERLREAGRGESAFALEDINWAHDTLVDHETRIRADATSLNLDSAAGVLRELANYADVSDRSRPIDVEKDLRDYSPAVEIPEPEQYKAAICVPAIPESTAGARLILEQFLQEPLDPWNLPVNW